MPTKVQQILDPWSTWNQAHNTEPVFVVKAEDWRYVMLMAVNSKDKAGRMSPQQLIDYALEMKKWHDENNVPL